MREFRSRLTYSNVMATMAVFIALGGTSYAALQLPRNSVGSAQIRAKAVGSSELRSGSVSSRSINDRSITLRDISLSARDSLGGQPGPAGPPGPPGPAGITYTAAVNVNANVKRGNAKLATRDPGSNQYIVQFDRNVDECVSTATLANVELGDPEEPPAGRITVGRRTGSVVVKTFGADGTPVPLPFHLHVAC